jgi:hypothetical protein
VVLPHPFVGPPALRQQFQRWRQPRPVDSFTVTQNPLLTQLQNTWNATQAAIAAENALRTQRPLVRIWDGNWNLQYVDTVSYSSTFSWILNDSGPGRTEIPYTTPNWQQPAGDFPFTFPLSFGSAAAGPVGLGQWIANDVDRVKNGHGRNVHITVDYSGARWAGRMNTFSVEQREDGDAVVVVDWLHDYENLKWYTVWSNPFL